MRWAFVAMIVLLGGRASSAETVYEFALSCQQEKLATCFARVESHLDRLKAAEQGRSFCMPNFWGGPLILSAGYPVSVLEHVRLAVSAARFGSAGRNVDDAMRDIVAGIYPCE
ncbi:hypothetical protein [Hyphomicrobium sp.]|uniref:hypothetical protein n=1 Tax=Hyphomicrobium sp. TaxID=82 RepID=UPI002E3475DB|nr:hypothetical protein [Hyphomicrobium sp.]HEX2841716.1 hypothetical protein [Hyphomicrobium sp.]